MLRLLSFSLASAKNEHLHVWENWKAFHEKSYETEEEETRRKEIFHKNVRKIQDWNADPEDTFTMAINHFGDLEYEEWNDLISMPMPDWFKNLGKSNTKPRSRRVTNSTDLPTSVDWESAKCGGGPCLTTPKNQKSCGSCYAFSATGAIEQAWASNHGVLTSLSEQEILDCSSNYHNEGCKGGLMSQAFEYAEANAGLCSESEYPYTASVTSCHNCTRHSPISGYQSIPYPDGVEEALREALQTNAVSAAVQANQPNFQFYASGIVTGVCGYKVDHGVLVVGYGTDATIKNKDYWKIKNSWGPQWGENGYIRICRNCESNSGRGQCGVYQTLSYPLLS